MPVMLRSMVAVAEAPVMTADWVSMVVVPFQTWKRTEPLLATSSSTPMTDWNRVQLRPVRSRGMVELAWAPTPLG